MVQDGWSPLMRACNEGHLDIVNVLIDKGANVNDIDNVSSNLLGIEMLEFGAGLKEF